MLCFVWNNPIIGVCVLDVIECVWVYCSLFLYTLFCIASLRKPGVNVKKGQKILMTFTRSIEWWKAERKREQRICILYMWGEFKINYPIAIHSNSMRYRIDIFQNSSLTRFSIRKDSKPSKSFFSISAESILYTLFCCALYTTSHNQRVCPVSSVHSPSMASCVWVVSFFSGHSVPLSL